MLPVLVERDPVSHTHHDSENMRRQHIPWNQMPLDHQDGAIEPIAREDGLQVIGRMVLGEADVGVDAQRD
jgi:hypothetical protein